MGYDTTTLMMVMMAMHGPHIYESKYLDSRIRIRRSVDWYSGTSDMYARRIKLIEIFNYHNVDRSNDARRL